MRWTAWNLTKNAATYPITITAQAGSITHSNSISLSIVPPAPAKMVNPAPGATLLSTTVTFAWDTGLGATPYQLSVGSFPGASDYFAGSASTSQSATVTLPHVARRQPAYVTLASLINGAWQSQAYTYTMGISSTASTGPFTLQTVVQSSPSAAPAQNAMGQTAPPPP